MVVVVVVAVVFAVAVAVASAAAVAAVVAVAVVVVVGVSMVSLVLESICFEKALSRASRLSGVMELRKKRTYSTAVV